MSKKNVRSWMLVLGVVPLALTLSGCFGLPGLPGVPDLPGVPGGGSDDVNDELVEDIIEGAGGGDIDFESGSLPAGFPEGDIPLIPGEIGPSMAVVEATAWTVTVYTDDQATAESAPALLEQAGFSNDSVFAWENDEYVVVVVTTEETDEGRWQVYYQVQKQQ